MAWRRTWAKAPASLSLACVQTAASAAFFSHVFVRDNVLVQINGELPGDKAKQYDAALQAMK